MALGVTQPLTEVQYQEFSVVKEQPGCKAETSLPSVRKCKSLDTSKSYGPPPPVIGIALDFFAL
jgi:hypothetical protein